MPEYHLYVPAPHMIHDIRRGSAIVGEPMGGHIEIDYEGGGASNVRTFEDKLHHAAGRRAQRYPTVAREARKPEDLVAVGRARYDEAVRHWVIADIVDAEALEAWAPGPHVIGGSDELTMHAAGLRWRDIPVHEQARLMAMKLPARELAQKVISTVSRRSR